ncbi:MAG: hypothetical protein JSW11_15780 [Candidatus Heimdallarchaeota archaeon]|nr:MAG: hypothetical protein JSW11_15780 [Candidatus Heimdallarchaeota archaeon]
MYRYIGEIGRLGQEPTLLTIRFLFYLVVLVAGSTLLFMLIVRLLEKETPKSWVKILKTSSVPKIERGVIGFLILSSFFVGLELLIISVIATIAGGDLYTNIFLYLIFYLFAFSIPFWLTITSEFTLS